MKALIFNDQIVDVVPESFEVHESMFWVDCPDNTSATTHRFVDGHVELLPEVEPQPALPRTMTPLSFIERFTEDEQLAVVTAAMQAPALRLWYDKLMAAQEVIFNDERLLAGMDALVGAGLISTERKTEILDDSL